MFNFIVEPEKKTVDINSTLFECENDNYIKILYNNKGIVVKIDFMLKGHPNFINEIVAPTSESLLRKNVISVYCGNINSLTWEKIIIYVNGYKIYEDSMSVSTDMIKNHQYHDFYLCNNSNSSQSFNGKFYDYSMLQNISEIEALNLHEYYKYIHNI